MTQDTMKGKDRIDGMKKANDQTQNRQGSERGSSGRMGDTGNARQGSSSDSSESNRGVGDSKQSGWSPQEEKRIRGNSGSDQTEGSERVSGEDSGDESRNS